MQISSKFTIAIHILVCTDYFGKEHKVTSDFLASSINVNPVIIRKILLQLRDAGLVRVARGTGGVEILRPLEEITLYDIYRAVDVVSAKKLFHFHDNPNPDCPVGRNIHLLLDRRLESVQRAMELELCGQNLADICEELKGKEDVSHQ